MLLAAPLEIENPSAVISIENASVSLGGRRILDSVNFRLAPGGHTVVQGRNGSGKSSLMRLLRGELYPDPDGGQVLWSTPQGPDSSPLAGREMVALASPALLELYVRQGWNLSGEELILSGLSDGPLLYSEPEPAEREQARALARTLGAEHLLDRTAPALSQGQLCLLFLARACISQPTVLLLDEFSNGLDALAHKSVMNALEIIGQNTTLVIATHRRGSLPACVQRELRLEDGRVTSDGPSRRIPEALRCTRPQPQTARRSTLSAIADPLVRIENATVYVQRVPVLHGITWSIQQGEQWLLAGANGAGKSTLLRLIAGEEHPAAGGSIRRHLPLHGGPVRDRVTLGHAVSLVSDRLQATYPRDLRGEEFVLSGFDNSIGLYRTFTRQERAVARSWMKRLGAASLAAHPLGALSTGQTRILLLARALVRNPEMLLLDEPFSGLDQTTRAKMMAILAKLVHSGLHLVLVTHHDNDVPPVMTHVARLENGRLVAAGPLSREAS